MAKNSRYEALKEWRKNNPIHYAYLTNKANAKRRGKDFSLTLEQFTKFRYKYKYMEKKGITREGYGMDRIDERYGYHIWNIQILKNPQNVRKYRMYDWQTKTGYTCEVRPDQTPGYF